MTQVAARRRYAVSVEADLRISIEPEDGDRVELRLTGSGSRLRLQVDDPSVFAGRRDAQGVRDIADRLARWGLVVDVVDRDGGRLLSIGNVLGPWWQRAFTRTRHLRIATTRGAWSGLRGRGRPSQQLLPSGGLGVPPTLLPLAPTFGRRLVSQVTTTDDPHRGGGPRLVLLDNDEIWRPEHPVHWLQAEVTTIGSAPGCTVVLPGLAPLHAEVRHDEVRDEYVVVALDPDTRVHGRAVVDATVLRTSARLQLADRSLVFVREEFADHGRPHGGRVGGEAGRQRQQHDPRS